MRMISVFLLISLIPLPSQSEEVIFELEWGFGPSPSEIYWDGSVQVTGGKIASMEAVSFESDRHDRLKPPAFQSYTVNQGTDGMKLIVEGDSSTAIRIQSKEGTFEWTVGELQKELQRSFPSKSKGKLVIRLRQFLGEAVRMLSDKKTLDSDPAVYPLENGRMFVLWRGFLGLPTKEDPKRGDQIRAVILDRQGKSGEPFDFFDSPRDLERITVAPLGNSRCCLVWAERKEGNWDLFSCSLKITGGRIECGELEKLTENPGVDRSPVLAAGNGSPVLVWQGWRNARSAIFTRPLKNGRWGEPEQVSDNGGNSWDPAVAISKGGAAAVAWSAWREGSYDIHLRIRTGESWSPIRSVAATERFEAHPALAYDPTGTLWIAYEEGRAGWGMDSHSAGLRSERNVRIRIWRNHELLEPAGNAAFQLPEAFKDTSEMAHLACDAGGTLWLFFRNLSGRGVWTIQGCSLGNDGWSPPVPFRLSAAGQNVQMAAAAGSLGNLLAVWPSDHRTDQVGKESSLYASSLPRREPRTIPVEGKRLATPSPVPLKKAPRDRPRALMAGTDLQLFFGDLHRHTELSVCRTGTDGSVEDAHRYAIDAAELDFLCITDHVQHVKILGDYDYWLTGKTADLNRVEDLHQPFYGYERSQRWPFGHRNIISPERNPKRVPRTADNRPWDANRGYPEEVRVTPPELWAQLVGQNTITIPHTTGNPVMGGDFRYPPDAMEPVVEIYQGCRISYEYASAPDPRRTRESSQFGGATKAGGFIWDALSKGYRYGFIASSDHVATHNSYACVWAKSFSNKDILEALRLRNCYAATDRIVCDVVMGNHLMGAEFEATEVPPLEVRIEGTAPLDRIDVIKDNRIVYTHPPGENSFTAYFTYRDLDAKPGVHYYYVRAIQKDRNLAWVSPIWVNLKSRPRRTY